MLVYNFGFWSNWENPQPITFDPENKLIWINSGITELDVGPDLYSNWKEWVLTYDNSKWSAAFYTFGGDPTSQNQTAPSYYFLTNGWKIMAKDVEVVIQTNLYSDDGLSPFIIDNAAITNRTSDVPVVRTDVEKRLDYGDRVYVDINTQYSGIEYPIGTIAQPVNNLSDAILIADAYSISRLYLRSNISITNSFDLQGFNFYGDINNIVVTVTTTIPVLDNTRFYNLIVGGDFAGSNTSIIDSVVRGYGIRDINGEIFNTEIDGEIKVDETLVISNSFSGRAGTAPGMIIDMNSNNAVSLSVRAYSGGVKIYNCQHSGDTSTIELIAGKITLDDTCTAGTLDLRGVGYLLDSSQSGCTVITTGLVDSFGVYIERTREVDERLSYDNKIFIDPISGSTGVTYPVGTAAVPVKDVYDLLYLSNTLNIKNIIVLENITIPTLPILVNHFNFIANVPNIKLTIPNGYNASDANIQGFTIDYADMKGFNHHFKDCVMGDISGLKGLVENCSLDGRQDNSGSTIKIYDETTFLNCYPHIVHNIPYIELNNPSGVTTSFRKYSGGIYIDKMEHPNDFISIDLVAGHLVIGSGCTNGIIEVLGVGFIQDESGSGCTIDTTGFISSTKDLLTEIDIKLDYVSGLTDIVDEKVDYLVGKIDYVSGLTDIVDEKLDYVTGITTNTNITIHDVDNKIDYISGQTNTGITEQLDNIENEINAITNKTIYISGMTEIIDNKINILDDKIDVISGQTDFIYDLDYKLDYVTGLTNEMNQNVVYMTSGFTDIEQSIDYMTISISGVTESVDGLDAKIDNISGTTQEMNQNVQYMTELVTGMTELVNEMYISVNNLSGDIKRILGLTQENFRISDHVYNNVDNTLQSAKIKIYTNSTDCDNDTNPFATYAMTALYDASGRLVNYKVIKT